MTHIQTARQRAEDLKQLIKPGNPRGFERRCFQEYLEEMRVNYERALEETINPSNAVVGEGFIFDGEKFLRISPGMEQQAVVAMSRKLQDGVKLVKDALRYIEVSGAYIGSMTAAEVEAEIKKRQDVSLVQIGANSVTTLASFNLAKARDFIKSADVKG